MNAPSKYLESQGIWVMHGIYSLNLWFLGFNSKVLAFLHNVLVRKSLPCHWALSLWVLVTCFYAILINKVSCPEVTASQKPRHKPWPFPAGACACLAFHCFTEPSLPPHNQWVQHSPRDGGQRKLWEWFIICSLSHTHPSKKKKLSCIQIPKYLCSFKKKNLETWEPALELSGSRWRYSLITACWVAQLNTISQKALKIQYPFSQTVCLSIPSHPPDLNQPTAELLWTATDFPCRAAQQNRAVSYF